MKTAARISALLAITVVIVVADLVVRACEYGYGKYCKAAGKWY